MNTVKILKTRDSATAILKKNGFSRDQYDRYIRKLEDGTFELTIPVVTVNPPSADPEFGPKAPEAPAPQPEPVKVRKASQKTPKEDAVAAAEAAFELLASGPQPLSAISKLTGIKRRRMIRVLTKDGRFVHQDKVWSRK